MIFKLDLTRYYMIKAIFYVILIVMILALLYLSYNAYTLFYSSPVQFHVNYTKLESQPSYAGDLQFYPDMRFNHSNLSYYIGEECPDNKKQDILSAFSFLHNKTLLNFYPSNNEDIEVRCGKEYEQAQGLVIAGEGGPETIINTTLFEIIVKGKILLLYSQSCPFMPYNIALHELLHVLGFKHSENPGSIMYNLSSCDQALTNDIVNEIDRLYSIKPLPDLYFEDIKAQKKGAYIDINFSVRNRGLTGAQEINVSLFTDSSELESFDLGDIEAGAGKILNVENIKVSFKTASLEVVIVDGEELNKENNKAVLALTS